MALIDSLVATGIADRAAYQYGLIKTAFETLNNQGTGFYWERVTATNDPQIEIPLLSQYYNTDQNLSLDSCIQSGMSQLLTIVTLMPTHFIQAQAGLTSWDLYCEQEGILLSDNFNQLHKYARGVFMNSNNIFSESVDIFGTIGVDAIPSVTFVDGVTYGDGTSNNKADGTNFAPTMLKIVVGSFGGVQCDLTITGTDAANAVQVVNMVIPNTAVLGDEITVGTTERWLDVTDVALTDAGGVNIGSGTDSFDVVNIKERIIAL